MRIHRLQFSAHLAAVLLGAVGIAAAAAAHADAGTDLSAPLKISSPASPQQCGAANGTGQATLRFPVGTTFVQTDAGLMVLDQPSTAYNPQPDWPNTGD